MPFELSPLALSQMLIERPSVTPDDAGCQNILRDLLAEYGFQVHDVSCQQVTNTWAQRGNSHPLLVFSGHTDVVPAGMLTEWLSPPFEPTIRESCLYGRGAADMKAALAAMVIASLRFFNKHPHPKGSIAFMLTSDEEGPACHGTQKIVEFCRQHHIKPDYCIIGEATSVNSLGDSIKVGRRGSLHGLLTIKGKQGHIAYPELADNPIHRACQALDALVQTQWDVGNVDFDPTSFQLYALHADAGANNLIPSVLTAQFNFRFSPSSTSDSLKKRVHQILDAYSLNYDLVWTLSGVPFYSRQEKLLPICQNVIFENLGVAAKPNTRGGTSDGRFIIELGCEIVEFGPVNHSIHQVNEHININDLDRLAVVYEKIIEQLILL